MPTNDGFGRTTARVSGAFGKGQQIQPNTNLSVAMNIRAASTDSLRHANRFDRDGGEDSRGQGDGLSGEPAVVSRRGAAPLWCAT